MFAKSMAKYVYILFYNHNTEQFFNDLMEQPRDN